MGNNKLQIRDTRATVKNININIRILEIKNILKIKISESAKISATMLIINGKLHYQ